MSPQGPMSGSPSRPRFQRHHMLVAMVKDADVDEGGGDQAVPLVEVEDEGRVVGAVVEELVARRVYPTDVVQHHPEEDGDVDREQEVGSGGGAWIHSL